jgi:deazaflavin-dependent oxidoreductase (nitroreductase family)
MSDRPSGASDYNTKIIEEFWANGGRVGGPWAGATLILIHHLGAKSGTERVTPVGYFPQGEGRYAIVASNGGSPTHPAWYHNLKAHSKTPSRSVPRRSRSRRRSWAMPPAPTCGRRSSRRLLPSVNSRPRLRGRFR